MKVTIIIESGPKYDLPPPDWKIERELRRQREARDDKTREADWQEAFKFHNPPKRRRATKGAGR